MIWDGGYSTISVPEGFEVRIVKIEKQGYTTYIVEKRRQIFGRWLWWSKATRGGWYSEYSQLSEAQDYAKRVISDEQRRRIKTEKTIIPYP